VFVVSSSLTPKVLTVSDHDDPTTPSATSPSNTSLCAWVGRTETKHDTVRVQPARFMDAALGRGSQLELGDELPALWHWLYFLDASPAGELGRDGHPRKGGFLPPVDLPRRMWAGGRFEFHHPLMLGADVRRVSTVVAVKPKSGRSGDLYFVTVRHEVFIGIVLAITEEHDIVYREDPTPGSPAPAPRAAPDGADASETITPTQVMLFRYSALTFNAHRIHYDVDYARTVEGYDGLVVHGPLVATLLVDLATRTYGFQPRRFDFRAVAPITDDSTFDIELRRDGDTAQLWARRGNGALAMTASADFGSHR